MNMNHCKLSRLAVSIAVAVCGLTVSVQAAEPYTFEGLSLGNVNGQDGWNNYLGSIQVQTPSGVSNTSTRVLGASSGEHIASRIDAGHTWMMQFSNTTSTAILQYDFRFTSGAVTQQVYVGLGHDMTGNGKVNLNDNLGGKTEVNPMLIANKDTSDAISFGIGIPASNYSGGVKLYPVSSLQAAPANVQAGDWIRVRLVMDLGGDLPGGSGPCGIYQGSYQCPGSGSVSVMNLTDGETTFTPVAGLQNFEMANGAYGFSAPAPYLWDGVVVDLQGAGAQLDNIAVMIPEPTTMALIGLGALLCLRRRSA